MAIVHTDHGTHTSWTGTGLTRTISGASIGTPSADRVVVVHLGHERDRPLTATIGGVSATIHYHLWSVTGAAIIWAVVPTGTTADIVINFEFGNVAFQYVGVSSATGMVATAYDTATGGATGTSVSTTIDVPANGAGFAASYLRTGGAASWTGLTEIDEEVGTLNGRSASHAADTGMSLETGRTIQVDWGGSQATPLVAVTFEEAASGSDTDVQASTDTLTLTESAASIALDVEVSANTDTLTLSQHPAAVSHDIDIQATADSLSLTEYPASIEVGSSTNVNASTDALSLASHQASISHDVTVEAATDALTVATLAAGITNPSGDTNILAGVSALTIGTFTVTIAGVVPIILPPPISTPASRTARVGAESRVARAAYENRTVTVPRKQQSAA